MCMCWTATQIRQPMLNNYSKAKSFIALRSRSSKSTGEIKLYQLSLLLKLYLNFWLIQHNVFIYVLCYRNMTYDTTESTKHTFLQTPQSETFQNSKMSAVSLQHVSRGKIKQQVCQVKSSLPIMPTLGRPRLFDPSVLFIPSNRSCSYEIFWLWKQLQQVGEILISRLETHFFPWILEATPQTDFSGTKLSHVGSLTRAPLTVPWTHNEGWQTAQQTITCVNWFSLTKLLNWRLYETAIKANSND